MSTRIIELDSASEESLEGYWLLIAYNIEDSFLEAGMVPNEDYTAMDLYKLAQPFVMTKWKKGGLMAFYPNGVALLQYDY